MSDEFPTEVDWEAEVTYQKQKRDEADAIIARLVADKKRLIGLLEEVDTYILESAPATEPLTSWENRMHWAIREEAGRA